MHNQKTDRKELREFIFHEVSVAGKQGIIGVLIAISIGAIISFTKEIDLIASMNRWLYIVGVALILLAAVPGSNLDYAYYSSSQTRVAASRRGETFEHVFRRFIRGAVVLLFAVVVERIRR